MTGDLQGAASAALCRQWLTLQDAGGYVAHCLAAHAILVAKDVSSGNELGTLPVTAPLLVVTQRCLLVFSAGSNWTTSPCCPLLVRILFLPLPATYTYSVLVPLYWQLPVPVACWS